MSGLQETIDDIVEDVVEAAVNHGADYEGVSGMKAFERPSVAEARTRILAAIAEALTSEAAIAAGINASYGDAVWNYEETEIVEGRVGTVPEITTAALAAAGLTREGT